MLYAAKTVSQVTLIHPLYSNSSGGNNTGISHWLWWLWL